ncbi:SLAP domain-containing protein [Companilactobacillus zhachilii]|uniref:SLAP domain-containing protein n=1 Tax=Companilactobacillus zhachilii TaxID=2304606 RepID=UPI004034D0CB
MKLRMNKFTMVCAVVLSSAVLFGTNSVNVQAADNTGGSSVVGSSAKNDEDKLIKSGEPDPVWGGIHWAIYAINGDENNLQLRLGNPNSSTVEDLDSSAQNDDLPWFNELSRESTSLVIVGNIKTDAQQEYLFSSMPNLTSITGLNKIDVSGTTDFAHMFEGDSSLSSVNLSDLDMSHATDTSDMFFNTNISTLTLSNNSIITSSSSIPNIYTLNDHTYSSNEWKDESNPTEKPISDSDLVAKYSGKDAKRPSTTWTRTNPTELFNYYIQYIDGSTGKAIPGGTYNPDKKGTVGDSVNLSSYSPAITGKLQSGYASTLISSTGNIESDESGNYYVKAVIFPSDSVNIAVNQKIGSDAPKDVSFKIPINDTSYKYADIADPANTTIDLNKSTIKIGDKDAESFAKYSSTSNDLNSILSAAITSQYNKSNVFGDDASGTTPITVNAVYTMKSTSGGSSSSGSHHNSSNNNENSTENNTEDKGGTTTEVKQTISTMTKDVNLYDKNGKLITSRALAENSAWFSDQTYDLNGTSYYRVANDEYVKASDVYIYTAENHIIDVKGKSIVFMVDSNGHKVTNRALGPNSEWYSDRYTIINGQKYYRVATDEFVSAADIALL